MKQRDNPEYGPESMGNLLEDMEHIREGLDSELDRLSEALKLSHEQVAMLGVALLGRHFDLTNDPETLVLVVRGTIAPYDTAMEAMFAGGPGEAAYKYMRSLSMEAAQDV